MRTDRYGFTNAIGDIDALTDNPESATTANLIRAIHDAYAVYDYHHIKPYEWYLSVCRICNAELRRRGEEEEPVQGP